MTAAKFVAFGKYVAPKFLKKAPAAGRRPSVLRPTSVENYDKRISKSTTPTALGLVSACYGQAIQFSSRSEGLRGAPLLWVVFSSGMVAWGILRVGPIVLETLKYNFIIGGIMALMFCLGVLGGALVSVFLFRISLFSVDDLSIIFDRKNRKAYCMVLDTGSGWLSLVRPWPVIAYEYPWELTNAQRIATTVTSSATVTTDDALQFQVRGSQSASEIVAIYQVGNTYALPGALIPEVWEHIRRFMEENGPHLPPGERTSVERPARSFLTRYQDWWKGAPVLTTVAHIVFPITAPLVCALVLFNWLSRVTARRVDWPAQVKNAIGPEVLMGTGQ